MILTLEVQGRNAAALEGNACIQFDSAALGRPNSGTIGRHPDSAWSLPDGSVSSTHAVVSFTNGSFVIEDRSTYGTEIRVRGNRLYDAQKLEHGVTIFIGPYEIRASISGGPTREPALPPVSREASQPLHGRNDSALEVLRPPLEVLADLNDRLTGFSSAPTSFGGPDEFTPTSRDGRLDAAEPAPVESVKQTDAPRVVASPHRTDQTDAQVTTRSTVSAAPAERGDNLPPDESLAAVMAAAGLDNAPVAPDLAKRLGRILRVVVTGLLDVVREREETKNEFRIQHTRLQQGGINPLRFAVDADEALYNLLVKRGRSYLEPEAAFEDALNQIRDHHEAERKAMREAFESVLAEFDPDRLQKQFDGQLKAASWLRVGSQTRYWRMYRERVGQITRDPDADFNRLFGNRFAIAYEEHIARLRAQRRAIER